MTTTTIANNAALAAFTATGATMLLSWLVGRWRDRRNRRRFHARRFAR